MMNKAYTLRPFPLIMLILAFCLNIGVAFGDKDVSAPGANESIESKSEPEPAKVVGPIKTEAIDATGKKVGQGIDNFGSVAANKLGDWINNKVYSDISWLKLLFCFFLLFVVVFFERIVRWAIQQKIKTIPQVEGAISWTRLFLKSLVKPLSLFLWVYGIYAALSPLYSHFQSMAGFNSIPDIIRRAADVGGTVAMFWFLYQLVALIDARLLKWSKATENSIDNMLVPLIGKTLRIFIAIIGGIMVIQNLTGVQIGPLLASLGIGGLAIAFAAKDSIANFFGTLTILFDKPFQVGERIIIDGFDGTVENVGFRSTRIRTLVGNLVTIPNEKVVSSTVENIGKRPNIRWLTQIGITYDTPHQKVREAVDILRSLLDNHEGIHPDFPPRVHFNGFNDWSLNITVVVWYHPPDWWNFQAWLQNTCLEILRRFNEAGIDFAFPSRTLYMANDDKRQLKLQMLKGQTDTVTV